MARLQPAARRNGGVEQSRVGGDQVDVELLRGEGANEGVPLHGHALPDRIADVEDGEMQLGSEEVAGRKVGAPVAPQLALGKRSRLLDAVVAVLVGEGRVEPGRADADLGKGARQSALRVVPVAVLADSRQREVVVERTGFPAQQEARVESPEAAAGDFGADLAALFSAARGQADGRPQRVAAEEDRGTPDDLDAVHGFQRNQVEVDLLDRGLVEPHAVEEDAHALGQARHRRHDEPAERQGGLEGVPLLVLETHTRQALENVREDRSSWRPDLGPI